MHPARPERLFLQNHWGIYRSDDSSESWKDIANGVPSDFGFAMVMHPRNPDCVYIVPVESDQEQISHCKSVASSVAPEEKVIVPLTFHIPGPLREFTSGRSDEPSSNRPQL